MDERAVLEEITRVSTQLSEDIARLERKVDLILKELKLEYNDYPDYPDPKTSSQLDEVYALLKQGKKIDAIKVYRMKFNVGLAEAKMVIDRMESGGRPR